MDETTSTPGSTPEVAAAPEAPTAPVEAQEPAKPAINFDDLPWDSPEFQKIAGSKIKRKVKIGGKEDVVDLETLARGYQSAQDSTRKWQEAADTRKQVEGLFAKLKSNPIEALKGLLTHPGVGLDFRKIITEHLAEEFEYESLPPEKKELADTRKKLAEYEAKERARDEAETKAKDEAFRRQYAANLEKDLVTAIDTSGLPKTEYTFSRVLYYMREALSRDLPLTAEQAIPLVREDYEREHQALVGGLDAPKLLKMLGPDALKKLEAHKVEEFKKSQTPAAPAAPTTPKERKTAPEPRVKRQSISEAMQEMRDGLRHKRG